MFRYTPLFTKYMVDYGEHDKIDVRADRWNMFGDRGTTNACAAEWRKFARDNGLSSNAESFLEEVTRTTNLKTKIILHQSYCTIN